MSKPVHGVVTVRDLENDGVHSASECEDDVAS